MNRLLLLIVLVFSGTIFSQAPTTATTAVTFNSIQGDRAGLSISKGNGSSRLIVARKDFPVNFVPIEGTSYLASTVFGNGQEVALGEYVFYSGAGTSTTLTNLLPGSTYHIAVFEFNGSGLTSSYLVSPYYAGSFTTLSAPTVQATNAQVSNLSSNTLTLSWTPGNGGYSIVLAKEASSVNANPVDLVSYQANTTFYQQINGASQIGVGNFVMYKGTGSSISITNLTPGISYHFMVVTYNGTTGPVYLTTNPTTTSAQTLLYPTQSATAISFNSIEGDRLSMSWTNGNGTGRVVVVRAHEPVSEFPQDGVTYTPNTNFTLAPDLGNGNKVMYSYFGNNFVVNGLTSGTTYYFAVFEYAGSESNRYYNVTNYATGFSGPVVAPQQNVAAIVVTNVTAYGATLTLNPGNGNGRFVVLRPNESTTYEPINLNSYYANNSPNLSNTYGNVAEGHKVIYKGTGSTITITNAQPNTTYYIAAFEFNGSNYPIYQKDNPALISFTTPLPPAPTVATTNLNFTSVEGNSFRIQWTNGNGLRRIALMSQQAPIASLPQNGVQYTAHSNFMQATEIAPGEKIIYDGNASSVEVSGLEIGTTYYVRLFEYNGTESLTNYLTTSSLSGSGSTASAPSIQATSVYVQQVNQQELRVYWTNGNGNRKLVIGRAEEPVDAVPQNLTSYNSSSYFGSGTQVAPGQRSVYYYNGAALGQESYTTVYSVSPGTTYHFKVFECNGVNAPVYATTNPGTASYFIGYEPLTPSTNVFTQSHDGGGMTVYIGNRGGGQRRIIVAREGSPVTVFPTDGETYTSNANFTLGQDLGDSHKVIYDGTGYFVHATGMEHSKTYHFAVIEYGGTGATADYLIDNYASTSGTTLSPPTLQSSVLSFNAITSVSANVSWTNGNGSNRMVVARKDAQVNAVPQDYTNYNYNQYFGYAGHLGDGNYVVYKGNATNITLQNLTSGTTYYTNVYEFNGSSTPVYLGPPISGSFTTLGPPQIQASQLTFSDILATSLRISCGAGSGQKRLILVKEGSPIIAAPSEHTSYTANSFFGSGTSIGDATYAVYNGFDSEVVVTGLTPGLTYYVAVYEFNAFTGGIINYLTPTTALGSFTTSTDLCLEINCPPGTACEQGGCYPIVYVVSGVVRDADTNAVLSGVTLSSSLNSTVTDAQGYYAIELVYGDILTLSKADYLDLVSEPFFESLPNFDFLLTSVCSFVNCPPGTACEQGGCFPIAYTVSGVVRDLATNEPLAGVVVAEGLSTVITDSFGAYSIVVGYGSILTFAVSDYTTFSSEPIFENLP
ncbi:hypothetical protein, partial [Flavobacterium orientale]|uniref:hypothetical protein n=1 Tax=Flavobacterium orientale TaxID=1756020 RepID=UPI0016631063